jgi:hypothetical protein
VKQVKPSQNIIGALDLRRRRGWLSGDKFKEVLENFIGGFKNTPFESPKGFPVLTQLLADSWPSILSEHVYEANAIQVQTCIYSGSNVLLSANKKFSD